MMMRITLSMLAVILFGAALCAPAQAERYRHLMFRETPYADFRGIHPVDEETEAGVAHYAFERDDLGRVTRIVYRIGDQSIDNNGVWDSFIWFAPEVRIAYAPGQEVHTYFNAQGERVTAHGNVYSAVYALNAAGERVSLAFLGLDGEPSESEWGVHRYDWRPSDDGHVFERRYNLAGEMVTMRPQLEFHEVKLEYDAEGRLAFMRNYGLNGEPTDNASGAGIDRVTYDLAGNFVRWQVYDRHGNAVEGNRPGVHLGEHLYDAHGNKIGLRGYDRHGNEQVFSWGVSLSRTRYDARGNRIEAWTYGPDGQEQGRLGWTYSADGTRVESIRGLTPDGDLAAHVALGGAALIRYVDGEDGQRLAEAFDVDMQPVQPN